MSKASDTTVPNKIDNDHFQSTLDYFAKSQTKRWRFVKDDDGHDYLIPAELENQFNEWVAESDPWREPQDEEDVYDGPSFDEYRTDMSPNSYTFTDPQEDE